MNLKNILIDLAVSDLKSARLLYDNGHFRTSYFFFQQGVEKANKAFGLLSEQISKDELLGIGHNQFKIYSKSIQKQEKEIGALIKAVEPFPNIKNHEFFQQTNFTGYHQSLNDGLRFIDSLRNRDLINIPATDLNYLLRQLRQIEKTKIKLPKNYEEKLEQHLLKIADWIGHFGTPQALEAKKEFEELLNDREKRKQYFDIITNQMLRLMIDVSFVNLT